MSVKIDNSSHPLPHAPGWDGKMRLSIGKPDNNASAAASGASINIGATSAQLRSMDNGPENSPANTAKLVKIKQAISEGRFQVNPGAVADSLIKSVKELISSQQA